MGTTHRGEPTGDNHSNTRNILWRGNPRSPDSLPISGLAEGPNAETDTYYLANIEPHPSSGRWSAVVEAVQPNEDGSESNAPVIQRHGAYRTKQYAAMAAQAATNRFQRKMDAGVNEVDGWPDQYKGTGQSYGPGMSLQ